MDIISADSIELVIDSIAAARQAAKVTIFGEASTLCEATAPHRETLGMNVESMVENQTYAILAIIFLLTYLMWLPHIFKEGNIRWRLITRHRHLENERELISKHRTSMIVVTWSLGIVLAALLTSRIVAQFVNPSLSFEGAWWIVGGIFAVMIISLYGWAVIKAVGYLILDMKFADKLLLIKRQLFFFSVILLSPLFIACGLSNYTQGGILTQLSVIVTIVLAIFFICQSFSLFMRQNFSILHWFLYLCGVEIFPLTFVWAITTRYLGI